MAKTKPDLQNQVDHLKQQLQEFKEKHARAVADYQNLQKRIEHQQSQFLHLTTAALIGKYLTILDDLERAAAHVQDEGLELVIHHFHELLKEEGVTEIQTHGQPFNPEIMDCVETVPGDKDQVVRVIQKGYHLGESLIRPAKVEVGTGSNK